LRGHDCKAFTQQLATVVGDNGVLFEEILAFEAGHSPSETALFEAIARVAARRDPRALVIPRIIPGFTDAHYFRAKGIIAYGFTPRWLTALDTQGIHGPDEKVSIANLERGVDALVEILRELSSN
jgi:acetylornithine deacetylase/succinyl-diaminopimelate desuccinylase-like protein